jgi:diaminohydroxyphosphoribosylaminopyrimidine deaminase/5-amino-6-(5-phosphoribosylamino)uracil reductase
VHQVAESAGRLDLDAVMKVLAEAQINDIWVEAGPTINGALLQGGLVDELIVYQAASVLGSDARGMFAIDTLQDMQRRPEFELTDVRKVGTDLRLCYKLGSQ